MWIDLLSMTAIGIFAACLAFIVRHSLKRRGRSLARWVMPAAIGASMIAYSVWNEYTWFERIRSSLPDSVAIVGKGERSVFWAPWTLVAPVTVRFIALDTRTRVESEQRAGLVLTELLLVERWSPTRRAAVAFDCNRSMRADLGGSARIAPDGTLEGGQWRSMSAGDPVLMAACRPRPQA